VQRAADPVQILADQRLVEAELVAQGGDALGGDVGRAEHDLGGVTGDQMDHQEGQHRDAERHQQEFGGPAQGGLDHLPSLASRRVRSERVAIGAKPVTSSRTAANRVP
jgi:hypothetical protein